MQSADLEATPTSLASIEGDEAAVLARFFEPEANLVVFRRSPGRALKAFCEGPLLAQGVCAQEVTASRAEASAAVLPASIRDCDGVSALQDDIADVFQLWQDLFEPSRSGLRFRVLDQAMCPRFHVDRVLARLIVSYGGSGTEWLPDSAVDRSLLGVPLSDLNDDPLAVPENIEIVPPYAIALLKGAAWPGNENRGLVHRSPPIRPPERRALLTIDILA